jgi:hypothetical protein
MLIISCKDNKTESATSTIDSNNLDGTANEESAEEIAETDIIVVTKIDTTTSAIPVKDGTLEDKEESKIKSSSSSQISNILEMEGYFQYFAESMVFYPCQTKKRFKVLDNAACKEVMAMYRTVSTEGAEKIYLRCMGEFKDFKSEDGGRLLIGLYIHKILVFDPKKSCG